MEKLFRVFDKKNKEMHYFSELTVGHCVSGRISLHALGGLTYDPDFTPLMQWVGDVPDVGMIWEGDIILVDRTDSFKKSNFGPVEYDGGSYGFISLSKFPRWVSVWEWPIKKVLGNIYENPELLNHE